MIFVYLLVLVLVVVDIWLGIKFIEYVYCANVRHQPPFVPANKKMRHVVISEILSHYGNAATVCEIGAGHGGLARYIARHCNVRVVALENMPFAASVSKVLGILSWGRCQTVWCDAFEWLDKVPEPIDVAVAYLGPNLTPRLSKYGDKIKVLLSLDFEIPNMRPVRIIDVYDGYTIYGGKKYPHRLFVYEF